jgi:hypothetical protein
MQDGYIHHGSAPDYGWAAQEQADVQEQLERQLQEWNDIAHSKLAAVREARKRSEYDAQLLANRIALLKAEDAKAWANIEATRRQAQEAYESRQQREAHFRAKEAHRQQKLEMEAAQREKNLQARARTQAAQADAKAALQQAKERAAQERKAQQIAQTHAQELKHVAIAEQRQEAAAKMRLQNSNSSLRSESPRYWQKENRARTPERSLSFSAKGLGLEQEEKELLRRMRFSQGASKGARPPRPELQDRPRLNMHEKARCAELASARSRFSPEPLLTFADMPIDTVDISFHKR